MKKSCLRPYKSLDPAGPASLSFPFSTIFRLLPTATTSATRGRDFKNIFEVGQKRWVSETMQKSLKFKLNTEVYMLNFLLAKYNLCHTLHWLPGTLDIATVLSSRVPPLLNWALFQHSNNVQQAWGDNCVLTAKFLVSLVCNNYKV